MFYNEINNKIQTGTAKIGIIGLGYVGLPLALSFSKKFQVLGYDINAQLIDTLKIGHSLARDNFI
jgi:UDP-N-acetyl-D-mannosaminuronate dehydrogenase